MHPDRMRLAAEHLRLTAQCLFESCTVNDQWDGEHPDEKQDCEEMVALADELEHAAGCLPNPQRSGPTADAASTTDVAGSADAKLLGADHQPERKP